MKLPTYQATEATLNDYLAALRSFYLAVSQEQHNQVFLPLMLRDQASIFSQP